MTDDLPDLRRKILDPQALPLTHRTLNVPQFLEDNEDFFDRLASLSSKDPSHLQDPSPHSSKSKSLSKLSLPREKSREASNASIQKDSLTLRDRNSYLMKEIKRLREANAKRQIDDTPILSRKQEQIREKSNMVERLSERNKDIREVLSGEAQMFDAYEKMCRRCQGVRKSNNELSEKLKECIKKLNELTGKDDNPNLFIMNFK